MKLYQVDKYDWTNQKIENTPEELLFDGSSSELCKALKVDNSYHIRINPLKNVVAFGDIDHCKTEDIFDKFMNKLLEVYALESTNEISYTKSYKEDDDEYSYHWSIPSIETNCNSIKKKMIKINEFKEYIDLSVYCVKFFRMPNQTNPVKPYIHHIIQGKMKDFLVHYIKKTSFLSIDDEPEPEPEPEVEHIQTNKVNYELINALSDEFHDYSKWCKMAWIFKSIGYPFEEFVRMSRTSSKFKDSSDCLKCWNDIRPSKINEGLLHSILKEKSPELYSELGLNYQYVSVSPVQENMNIINIEQRYLIATDNELLNDTNDILTNTINEFFVSSSIKSLNIKSPYDTGKTKLLEKMFTKYDPKKILWLSYRKTLTNDILGSFGDKFQFKDYQEKKYDSDRLIIQVESILKLKPPIFEDEIYNIPKYDLVIVDEVESILAQFDSSTFGGKARDAFEFMTEIIKGSTKLITLDGDMSSRSYSFINHFGESRNIVNKILFNKRHFKLNYNVEEVHNNIKQDMRDNKKVVVASMSPNICDDIKEWMRAEFPNKKVLIYTGKTDDKNKLDLLDVLKSWCDVDVLLYSPTIEAGVSFDKEHFDKIYGVVCGRSTSQRAFIQMLSRVRKIRCDTITILNISSNFKINNINSKNMYSYEEVKQSLISLSVVSMNEIIKDGTITKHLSLYDINHVYNKMEQLYKHDYYFLAYLKYLLENKGHKFDNLDNKTKPKKKDNEEEVKEDTLMNVVDINRMEYENLLYKQQQSQATAEDKLKIKKFVFKKSLGVDKLNSELIDSYEIGTIKKYIGLIDTENIKKTTDAHYKEEVKKVELITELISDIGFKNMYARETTIRADIFTSKFNKVVEKSHIFSDDKASRILFNSRSIYKQYDSIKAFLGCVNTLLEPYSLIVKTKKGNKKIEGKRQYEYYLSNDTGREFIDELLQYRINKGLVVHDNKDIRKYEMTKTYINLIDIEPDSEQNDDTFFNTCGLDDGL